MTLEKSKTLWLSSNMKRHAAFVRAYEETMAWLTDVVMVPPVPPLPVLSLHRDERNDLAIHMDIVYTRRR